MFLLTLASDCGSRTLKAGNYNPVMLNPKLSSRYLPANLIYTYRLITQSHYDPPFSPISKTPAKPPTKKPKTKKSKTPKAQQNLDTFPVKSDLPFDFRYSYTETNTCVQPIAFRETPKFSPFGPGRLHRKWTGTCAPVDGELDKLTKEAARKRKEVLGEDLNEDEVCELVERYRHSDCSRQINLGEFLLFL